jgi:toxin HigB-1
MIKSFHHGGVERFPLKGRLEGHWAVWVDENWRLTFRFDGQHAELVDCQDYH